MSLISFRNVTAPLRSKFQIGGLIIGALLVLVIRLAGGGASSGGPQSQDSRDTISMDESDIARRNELTEILNESLAPRRAPSKRSTAAPDELLDGLVGGRFDKEQKQRRQEEAGGNSFEDIRRSLGIE